MTRIGAVAIAALMVASVSDAVAEARGRTCRQPEGPPGVRVQLPPECGARGSAEAAAKGAGAIQRAGKAPGSIDLGNGSELRVGGQVRVDTHFRR